MTQNDIDTEETETRTVVNQLREIFEHDEVTAEDDEPWDFTIERAPVFADGCYLNAGEMEALHEMPVRIHSTLLRTVRLEWDQ